MKPSRPHPQDAGVEQLWGGRGAKWDVIQNDSRLEEGENRTLGKRENADVFETGVQTWTPLDKRRILF